MEPAYICDGLHYEQYDSLSPVFQKYNVHFSYNLVRLYGLTYKTTRTQTGQWSEDYYYHCTGNCRCLARMANITLTEKACSQTWCDSFGCPIQNILKIGLSICFAHHGGHYFSDVFNISKTYGLHKDPKREFLAVLICRARDIQTKPGNHNIKFVERSEHILPYYLALVRV